MFTVKGLSSGYDSVNVLHDVDIEVQEGKLTVVLGANGSGKSSLFRTISGLVKARTGTIQLEGASLVGLAPDKVVKLGIAHCPEGRHLFPRMSVEKNLRLGSYVRRSDKGSAEDILSRVFELFPILVQKRNDPAGSLSGGQQQMVAIGRALMSAPRLLILDEPSMGLAPLVTDQVLEAVSSINADGISVLLAEQNAEAALRIAHYGYVLAEGRVVLSGPSSQLLSDPEVQSAYLGF